jgi:predicted ATPase
VGRGDELTDLDLLIKDPQVRLITIIGPGGMGKTRLALAAAEQQLAGCEPQTDGREGEQAFPNGVFFVPLAHLSEPNQIMPSLAEALQLQLGRGRGELRSPEQQLLDRAPEQQLLDYLREKQVLLVLDNLEHLLGGTKVIADMLQTAPGVKVLATSRERLHLHEEQAYPIQGLPYPDWERPDDTADYAAGQLFLQAARRTQPDFELGGDDLTYLARICRLLEGMPLGLELAAGWVDALSLAAIAAEIERSLDFLETEWRDVPERHRSMRAVFDTSWRCLSAAERELFAQLSVFRGGFTSAAAQEVAGAELRTLAKLVHQSLLQFSKVRERYQFHELLRHYGAEKLAAEPESEAAVRDRHSAFYCAALEAWEADMKGARETVALVEIEADLENVRAAWDWAMDHAQFQRLDQALDGWALFHESRGNRPEGERALGVWQEQMTTLISGAPADTGTAQCVLARILMWRGHFNRSLGRSELADTLLEQSQALLDSAALAGQDMQRERAFPFRLMLWAAGEWTSIPNWGAARRHREESLSLFRALGDPWNAAWCVAGLGTACRALGDHDQAKRMYEESLASFRALGCVSGVCDVLNALGSWARGVCDYDQAQRYYEESLALARSAGHHLYAGFALHEVAALALFRGLFEAAAGYLQEGMAVYRETGNRAMVAQLSVQLAVAFWMSGELPRADETIQEGERIAGQLGTPWPLNIVSAYRAWLDTWAGRYAEARAHAATALALALQIRNQWLVGLARGVLGWAALAEERYAEAAQEFQESLAAFQAQVLLGVGEREYEAWSLAGLGRAELGLGQGAQGRRHLHDALEIVVHSRDFIPLLHLLPVIPVALADAGEVERAVELYATAESHPGVANARLFADIAGRHIKATAAAALAPEVVEAAQARGQARDWWETAEALLAELRELGWAGS